jgi:hypothetical protein
MDISLQQAGQMNFSLPHDVVQLPSGGVFYKNKKKSVKIGYLTAADENIIISAASNITRENIMMSLIRNKMYETDMRPEELLEGDVEAIMIFLRNTSFGPEYKLSLVDPSTNNTFESSILLDELNILKPEVSPDENGTYTTILPKSGVTVKLKPLNFGELTDLTRMAENYPVGRVAPRVTWKLQKQIVELNGDSDKGKIAQFSEQMPISDSKYIRQFFEKNEPKLDLSQTVIAPSGEKVNFTISFGVEFFRPFF